MRSWRAIALVVAVAAPLACSHAKDDDCQRAFARLARIAAARGWPPMRSEFADQALEGCRRGGTAGYDPVVNCARAAATDEAAAACIDKGVRQVLHSPSGSGSGSASGGQGLNPLLDTGASP